MLLVRCLLLRTFTRKAAGKSKAKAKPRDVKPEE